MFYGWPANNGIWAWGEEIAVGFTEAVYQEHADSHSRDESKPTPTVIARSLDGGETWNLERPDIAPDESEAGDGGGSGDGETRGLEKPIDFLDPDVAIRVRNHGFQVSHDRCRTWQGPYFFPKLGFTGAFTARTDYLPLGTDSCLFFISLKDSQVQAGSFSDRALCIRTDDGGCTFRRLGFMLPENPQVRSVMPATVRIDAHTLVSVLRRRYEGVGEGESTCWIDAAISENLGETWRFLSRIADTHSAESVHNGNPPSMVKLVDGRLCVVYGYRAPGFGIRAKRSVDGGRTWGDEMALRNDARTWDIGYPRSVVRPDGKIVSVYYFTTDENPEQHIAATIWHPDELRSGGA
jgi:hypothetical protein